MALQIVNWPGLLGLKSGRVRAAQCFGKMCRHDQTTVAPQTYFSQRFWIKRMAIKHGIERLEQKRGGGLRDEYQRDIERSLIDKPLVVGETLIVPDEHVAEL